MGAGLIISLVPTGVKVTWRIADILNYNLPSPKCFIETVSKSAALRSPTPLSESAACLQLRGVRKQGMPTVCLQRRAVRR